MDSRGSIVDVNAWLGSWPFQYFRDDSARRLEGRLAAEGIGTALVGSPEAAFNPDCLAVNRLLLRRLKGSASLRPVLALDPTKGDWRDILAVARGEGAPAVRLLPTYHGYDLASPAALAAVEDIAENGHLALFLQVRMEDERTHHPLCKIPSLSIPPIVEFARRFPGLPVAALCPLYREAVELGKGPENLRFDLAYVETLRTVPSLLGEVPVERVLFGSHTPFLQIRAAVLKIAAPSVPVEARRTIGSLNARAMLGKSPRAKLHHDSGKETTACTSSR
jgi:hypothetical protein